MTIRPWINTLPGCARPSNCRARNTTGLCIVCQESRADQADSAARPVPHAYVVRIELSAGRRRKLGDMAREAGIPADQLASRLLSDLIDEDAAAHQGATA